MCLRAVLAFGLHCFNAQLIAHRKDYVKRIRGEVQGVEVFLTVGHESLFGLRTAGTNCKGCEF